MTGRMRICLLAEMLAMAAYMLAPEVISSPMEQPSKSNGSFVEQLSEEERLQAQKSDEAFETASRASKMANAIYSETARKQRKTANILYNKTARTQWIMALEALSSAIENEDKLIHGASIHGASFENTADTASSMMSLCTNDIFKEAINAVTKGAALSAARTMVARWKNENAKEAIEMMEWISEQVNKLDIAMFTNPVKLILWVLKNRAAVISWASDCAKGLEEWFAEAGKDIIIWFENAATSVLDKFVHLATGVLDKLPTIPIPDFKLPDIQLPKIPIPDIQLPDIKLPDIQLPDIQLPDIKLPDVQLPDIQLPDIKLPEMPVVNIPNFGGWFYTGSSGELPNYMKNDQEEIFDALPGMKKEDPSRELADQLGLWPGALVPICESPEFANESLALRHFFYKAMNVLTAGTCIRYINATVLHSMKCLRVQMIPNVAEEFYGLYFVGRCYMRPQREIFLQRNDTVIQILRKLMHAIAGLFYEHQRNDRDEFVRVNYQSIEEGYFREFDIIPTYPPDIEGFPEFSFKSIFHFPRYYRSKNGGRTIEPLEPRSNFDNVDTEKQSKFFYIDALRVNMVYRQLVIKPENHITSSIYGPAHCLRNPPEHPYWFE